MKYDDDGNDDDDDNDEVDAYDFDDEFDDEFYLLIRLVLLVWLKSLVIFANKLNTLTLKQKHSKH